MFIGKVANTGLNMPFSGDRRESGWLIPQGRCAGVLKTEVFNIKAKASVDEVD